MKGHISITVQIQLIFLIFSFFLPKQSWGEDPVALPQKGQPIVVRTDRAGGGSPTAIRRLPAEGGRQHASFLTPVSTLSTLQGGETPTRPPAAPAGGQTDQERLRKAAQSYVQLLLITVLLLLFVLIFVILAILLRRRRVAGRKRPEPTVLEDLWTKTEEQER